jgi:membrane protease YdiL (CAAX protease family)
MVTEKVFFNQNFAKTRSDMKLFYTLLITGTAALLLVTAPTFTNYISLHIHSDNFVNGLATYQIFALTVATLATISILLLNPASKQFIRIGQINIMAEKEKWLGINGKSSWKVNGLQLLFFVSAATGICMFLAVKYTNSMDNFTWSFMPFVLVFSLTNAVSEELIFRFGIVGGLFNQYSKPTILILSAILFGLPHYFGFPSGFIGILMSAVLGYILCKATIETKGLSIAWTIHFIQDIIIFTALMMMHVKQNTLL